MDVALAIDLVEGALTGQFDAAIVFTSDTDILPALELVFRRTPVHLEIACWRGAHPLWFPQFMAAPEPRYLPYCHFLGAADFRAARQRKMPAGPERDGQ